MVSVASGWRVTKCGESLERGFEAFFCNEPPGLQEAPATVGRERASLERDFAQGDAGALEADFFAGTTEIDEGGGERFRAHEDEPHGGEHLLGGGAIGGFVQIDEDIGAVKGNHAGPFPCANERQEMDGDVAEVDVEEARVGGVEDAADFRCFAGGKLPGRVAQLPIPNTAEEVAAGFRHDVDGIEWEALGFFALLRDDDGTHAFERRDLPVDVEHLRFKKGRAIGRDDGRWLRRIHITRVLVPMDNEAKGRARPLPTEADQNDPGDARGIFLVVSDGVVWMTEVAARRARVQDLKRIPTASGAGNGASFAASDGRNGLALDAVALTFRSINGSAVGLRLGAARGDGQKKERGEDEKKLFHRRGRMRRNALTQNFCCRLRSSGGLCGDGVSCKGETRPGRRNI